VRICPEDEGEHPWPDQEMEPLGCSSQDLADGRSSCPHRQLEGGERSRAAPSSGAPLSAQRQGRTVSGQGGQGGQVGEASSFEIHPEPD